MPPEQVQSKVTLPRKVLSAYGAGVRPFTQVQSHVTVQIFATLEDEWAQVAEVWLNNTGQDTTRLGCR